MCVYSMIMDHYDDKWRRLVQSPSPVIQLQPIPPAMPSQEEIDEFHRLLERAREYDRKHNQPDCELEEKKRKLQKLADELGIEINFDVPQAKGG